NFAVRHGFVLDRALHTFPGEKLTQNACAPRQRVGKHTAVRDNDAAFMRDEERTAMDGGRIETSLCGTVLFLIGPFTPSQPKSCPKMPVRPANALENTRQ